MRRLNRTSLRGSVMQNTASVRMRGRETSRFGFLIRLGALAGSLALLLGLGFWLWHIGWPQRQAGHLLEAGIRATQKAQFAVKNIDVEGRQQAGKDDLLAALGAAAGMPILTFDPAAAEARIAKLPWVANAVVERRLPDTILIFLTEHVPMARWQHDGRTVVIDTDGDELPEAKLDQFPQLPLVVGADAAGQAKALLDTLKDYPAITQKMTAAVRVGERRWDIHLQPKIVARMPEQNIDRALDRLADLITDQKILERDIVAIDLRDPTRMVFEPAGAAAAPSSGETRL